VTVLIWAFPKNRQANLTAAQKAAIREIKHELDVEMRVKYDNKEE
jgi:ADP-ribose pyrophosphatase YjhB (NUDIX family)